MIDSIRDRADGSRNKRQGPAPKSQSANPDELRLHRETSAGSRPLALIAIGYWAVFWIFNGLDKFLNRTDIGALHWYGKDRKHQFNEYFANMDVPQDLTEPVLLFAGIWEIAVGALFLAMLCFADSKWVGAAASRALSCGFAAAGLTLIAFSMFDIVSGDRAELREHGLYLMLLMVSWMVVRVHRQAAAQQGSST